MSHRIKPDIKESQLKHNPADNLKRSMKRKGGKHKESKRY